MLQQRFGAVQAERDVRKQRLEASVHEVLQKTGEHAAGLGQAGCSLLLGLHCFKQCTPGLSPLARPSCCQLPATLPPVAHRPILTPWAQA